MNEARDLYRELLAAAPQPDAAEELLSEIAARASAADAEEQGEVEELLVAIIGHPALCAKALLQWLAGSAQPAGVKLIRRISVEFLQATEPVKVVFPTTDAAGAVSVGKRMNALYVTPAYAAGWVLAILETWPADESAVGGADDVLYYLVREFPRSLGILLAQIKPDTLQTKTRELVEHYRKQIDDEQKLLDTYPFLREFAMSREERDAYRSIQRQDQKDILRKAREKSVMLQFVTQRRFKYARAVSLPIPGKPAAETTLEMKAHTVATELPESEWADPITGAMSRQRLAKG